MNSEFFPEITTAEHRAAGRAHVVDAPDDAAMSSEPPISASASLLLVEDDFLVATEAEAALRDAGYDVGGIASSGEDALHAAASVSFNLAVMDIRLASRMDGVDCALELFKRYGLRCVFATAHYDAEVRCRAEPAQPLAWLAKPYSRSSLVSVVRDALDRLSKPR
jgi:DNA-binding NarL/FixJ family response regulator